MRRGVATARIVDLMLEGVWGREMRQHRDLSFNPTGTLACWVAHPSAARVPCDPAPGGPVEAGLSKRPLPVRAAGGRPRAAPSRARRALLPGPRARSSAQGGPARRHDRGRRAG